jgi:hypothetical protein
MAFGKRTNGKSIVYATGVSHEIKYATKTGNKNRDLKVKTSAGGY